MISRVPAARIQFCLTSAKSHVQDDHSTCMVAHLNRLLSLLLLFGMSCSREREPSGGNVAGARQNTAVIVQLSTGDSVEVHSSGPAIVPDKPPGLVVEYHPFFAISDTARVYAVALALFSAIEPRLDPKPPWVALKAVDRSAAERSRGGFYAMRSFGVVLDHGADGLWYRLHATTPISGR